MSDQPVGIAQANTRGTKASDAACGLAFAFAVGAPISAGSGMMTSWPSRYSDAWTVAWICCACAMVSAFRASKMGPSLLAWIFIKASLLIALWGAGVATFYYETNYHDYPWLVVAGLATIAIVGGWRCQQRDIALGMAAFLVLWLYGAALPARPLPQVDTRGDVRVTLEDSADDLLRVRLESLRGVDLATVYDLENVTVEGTAGILVPVHCWDLEVNPSDASKPGSLVLQGRTFAPSWLRSWDAAISVPVWPRDAAASVTIPIPKPGDSPATRLSDRRGPVTLQITDFGWRPSTNELPERACLGFKVRYSGIGHTGLNSQELRVSDDLGHVVNAHAVSADQDPDGPFNQMQLDEVDPKAKSLRIDLYADEQRAANVVVFHFKGVPNEASPRR